MKRKFISAETPRPTSKMVDTDAVQGDSAFVPLGMRLVRIDTGRRMTEMERVFLAGGSQIGRMEALATLRSWRVDSRLDSATRQRASAILWKVQPNGWDEV